MSLDCLATPAVRLAPDGTVTYANDHYCVSFRDGLHDVVGASIFASVPSPSHARISHDLSNLRPGADTAVLEFPVTDARGRNRWLNWSLKARFGDGGEIRDVLAIARPIADDLHYRNALEDLLRISNDPTKSYEDRARMIMAVGIKYFDAELAGITRLDGDVATPIILNFEREGIHEKLPLPRPRSYVDLVLRAGPVVAIHNMHETEFVTYPFYDNLPLASVMAAEIYTAGRFYGIINFGTLTPRAAPFSEQQIQFCRLVAQWLGYTLEQQQLLEGLEASASKYRRIYENAPVMMAILDAQHTLLDVNRAMLAKLGYSAEELVGKPITDLYTPETRQEAFNLPIVERPATVDKLRRDFVARDGRIIQTSLSSLKLDNEDMPALAVIIDVSERHRLQQDMTELNGALMRANEDLKRFNTVAAHDLQEPLRKIRMFGNQLAQQLEGQADSDAADALAVITTSAERLSRLVRDLLAYSRESERGYTQEAIRLVALIEEVIGDLALMIEETGADVVVEDLPEVLGDPVPVQRLFHNVIINALKYRRAGVAPEVRIFARPVERGQHEIVVRDNGVGVLEGYEETIFEPFVRLQSARASGSGIGLALCRSIALGHGWKIRAERRPEHGTDLILTMPTARK